MNLFYTAFLLAVLALAVGAQAKPTARPTPKPKSAQAPAKAVTKELPTKVTKEAAQKTKLTKQAILKIEHEWALALLHEDTAKLDTILADNLQYTRSNGKVENKATYLEPIKKGITTYSMVKREHVKIQVNGETAIVTAQWRAKLQNKPNPPLETKARYLHVYMKQNGRWVLTAHQNTEIK